jgi:uncharacterized sulfatase
MPRQVILLMTDTQRRDMLACYGNPTMVTPNLDRLASQGLRFTRAYTCQPVCGPARAAIFTGTWPHTNGQWANNIGLVDTIKTLGQRLSENGILAGYIGKWHVDAFDYFGRGEAPPGWDPATWYDMRNYLEELSPEDRLRSRKAATNREHIHADFTFAHRCSDRAIDFLQQHKNDDFLLVVSYDEPHGPFLCPPPYCDMYKDYRFPASQNLADNLQNKPDPHRVWAGPKAGDANTPPLKSPDFFGCNSFVDAEIGRVLDAIDQHAKDALVIYTADHGDALLSHRLVGKGPAMYEEITGIPFLVRWPGNVQPNTVCPHLASHIDITPTILDAFNLGVPASLEGQSMLSLFKNPAAPLRDNIFIEWGRYEIDHDGFGGFQPIRCIVSGHLKLVINLLTTDELYDLEKDPQEMTNLIDSPDYAARRDQLHNHLLDWMNDTRDPFRGYYWERRPWRKDARPATYGYTRYRREKHPEAGEKVPLDYNTGLEVKEMNILP